MQVSVRKWGNSPAIRIPAPLLAAAGLRLDQRVEMRVEEGRVVIEPIIDEFDLTAALAAITEDNRHDEVDFGPVVGNEAW